MDHPLLITLKTLDKQFKNVSVITLNKPVFTIGRALENYAVIPYLGISRRHCILKQTLNSSWTLRDISSGIVNINSLPVQKNIDHPLCDEDVIKFDVGGEFTYVFEWKPKEKLHVNQASSDNIENNTSVNIKSSSAKLNASEYSFKKLANENEDLKNKLEEFKNIQNINVGSNLIDNPPSEKKNDERATSDITVEYNELIETELQCAICSEPFYKAVLLNCGHTYCELCINQWMKKKKECPTCRRKISQKNRNLTIDSVVENMISKLDQESQNRRNELIRNRKIIALGKRKRNIKPVLSENSNESRRTSLRTRSTAN